MNLKAAIEINADAAAGTTSMGSNLTGRKYWVTSKNYGNSPAARFPRVQDGQVTSGPYDDPQEAEKASQAMPYTKVSSAPQLEQTPAVRDIARKRAVRTSPDVDAKGKRRKSKRNRRKMENR